MPSVDLDELQRHIMTLAGDASNLLEAADVLYKAAWALIGLERYEFAEELLQAAVHADPGHVPAKCQLGLVLNRLGRSLEAEECLTSVRQEHPHLKDAFGALGRVYKDMWRDKWMKARSAESRRSLCLKHQTHAHEALRLYRERLRIGDNSHYAGINILALCTWLRFAARESEETLSDALESDIDQAEPEAREVVTREGARDLGDVGDKAYWAHTSLAELALCDGNTQEARRLYEKAAYWPNRGRFDIQSMLSHLYVYRRLGLEEATSRELIRTLEKELRRMGSAKQTFKKVALCVGHPTGGPGEGDVLTEDQATALKAHLKQQLKFWEFSTQEHLGVCCGNRGAEIAFAECCHELGMNVELLVPLPEDEFIKTCVHLPGTDWHTRYTKLLGSKRVRVRFQHAELGAPPPTASATQRGLLWCVNSARVAVEDPTNLHLLLVLAREHAAHDPAIASLIARVDELASLRAIRHDIDPARILKGSPSADGGPRRVRQRWKK
jgi:tetratricopeptide (TPR) repeat protein